MVLKFFVITKNVQQVSTTCSYVKIIIKIVRTFLIKDKPVHNYR